MRFRCLLFCVLATVTSCRPRTTESDTQTLPAPPTTTSSEFTTKAEPKKLELAGLHNVYQVSDKLISGNAPEGAEGFRSLRVLEVKTIISVDGTTPDVAQAKSFGMRYVHLPISYAGVSQEKGRQLARAVQELPGKIYLHCHHGKHRGPAAVAAIQRCLDENCTTDSALAWLQNAGTDPKYRGLLAVPKQFKLLTADELKAAKSDFPEKAAVHDMVKSMARLDATWDNVKQIRTKGWHTIRLPSGDDKEQVVLEPTYEAVLLHESFREAVRFAAANKYPEQFKQWLKEAETSARDLEQVFRTMKDLDSALPGAEKAYKQLVQSCTQCHNAYRDNK